MAAHKSRAGRARYVIDLANSSDNNNANVFTQYIGNNNNCV